MPARSRYRCVNALSPEAAGRCDTGGCVVRRSELQPQMRWAGDRLVETGMLACARHLDVPNPQERARTLSPDPVPVRDPRPLIDLPD